LKAKVLLMEEDNSLKKFMGEEREEKDASK